MQRSHVTAASPVRETATASRRNITSRTQRQRNLARKYAPTVTYAIAIVVSKAVGRWNALGPVPAPITTVTRALVLGEPLPNHLRIFRSHSHGSAEQAGSRLCRIRTPTQTRC